ncbi:hypothetical protein ZEAMMB73_Zm00001d021648 [Zea mays]|uniref:Uncharacterized protein n=1 Tax=Zea mays TaxID=4577 RepID=A0A1D6IDI1_MAIZE|nr:hypothetical protein ZEAMMB73_Zm00001d021648 [Zea mays]ONM57845.1 hypothetical protein ZEAMMB73_Zm00001d021648 [Zea mays]ONM57847.1 hypothetical protein ZEAMMB73_Zm00001d021648 [Zea mays]ONM57851.1 hypothetical protein ZEAMMB73_Zm00001d021648 [Zea mays]ONM57854.1 hypothetical protein ZEAMMB73_Zm00001d021648 [Zea mays]
MRRYSALPNGGRQETLADRAHRYRGIVLVILAPLALVSLVLLLMPRSPAGTMGSARDRQVRTPPPGDPLPDLESRCLDSPLGGFVEVEVGL